MHVFSWMPIWAGAIIFLGLFIATAVIAGLVVHRFVPAAVFEEHNEIAGFMFAVVGVVYAVLLAFLAIAVWERFDGAEVRTYDEANQLSVIYRGADEFPSGNLLRAQLSRYVDLVIADEWPKMNQGEQSEEANLLLEQIAYEVRHLRAATAAQQDVLTSMITNMDSAMVDRDYRLSMSATGINQFLWAILFLGAAVTMLFSYLFAFRRRGAQNVMIGLLAGSLGIVLYLIAVLDYPYRGAVRISPEAFVNTRQTFEDVNREDRLQSNARTLLIHRRH